MRRSSVISITSARQRSSRVSRAIDARRKLRPVATRKRPRGRVWLNGVQLGEPAYAHLAETYD
jgi:hypothetical protein